MTKAQLRLAWGEELFEEIIVKAQDIYDQSPDHYGEPAPDLVVAVAFKELFDKLSLINRHLKGDFSE